LQLDLQGKTIDGGYRMTAAAFSQIAQVLAPGLSKMMPDICGTITLPPEKELLTDGTVAIEFWNWLVELRFPLVSKYLLLKNRDSKTIEGLIGKTHQYLGNFELFGITTQELADVRPDVDVYAAMLVGRKFTVWFRSRDPLTSTTVAGNAFNVYDGYYFTNGEATGTSVRGTVAAFTPVGVCLGSYRKHGGRVTHAGKNFHLRLAAMVSEVAERSVSRDDITEGLLRLQGESMGFDACNSDESRREHRKRLIRAVTLLGVGRTLARDVVDRACALGRHSAAEFQTHDLAARYASRKLYDLFVPLMWVARQVDSSRREKLEQAAYALLTGKFVL